MSSRERIERPAPVLDRFLPDITDNTAGVEVGRQHVDAETRILGKGVIHIFVNVSLEEIGVGGVPRGHPIADSACGLIE